MISEYDFKNYKRDVAANKRAKIVDVATGVAVSIFLGVLLGYGLLFV